MDTLHQFPKRIHIKNIRKQVGEETIIHIYSIHTVWCETGPSCGETVTDWGRCCRKGVKRTNPRIGLQKMTPLRIFIIRIIHELLVWINQEMRQTGHVAGIGTRNVQIFWHIWVDAGVILKWILQQPKVRMWIEFNLILIGFSGSFLRTQPWTLESHKSKKFLHHLRNYQCSYKYLEPCSSVVILYL